RYYLSKARKSWTNSRSSAKADGADLIVFESKAEFDFVMNEARKTTQESMWIGLYQKDKLNEPKGNWVWVNGMDLSSGYTINFGTNYGQPDGGENEDYAEAWRDGMNDGQDSWGRYYLVEIDKNGDNSSVDFTDTTAANGIRYYYKLKSKITSGDQLSGFSNIKGAKPNAGYPLPSNITLSNAGRMVKVKWTNPITDKKGTGTYKLFGGLDSTSLKFLSNISDRDSSYIDSNRIIGKTYYYKLKSIDADGVESEFTKAYGVVITSYLYVAKTGKETAFGSSDDPFSTINDAITASLGGDTVILKRGSYSFAETQRFNKNIVVGSNYIASKDTVDIKETIISSAAGIGNVFSGTSVNKTLIGLTFQNNKDGVFNFDNVVVDRCYFIQNGSATNKTGRFISFSGNSEVKNSKFIKNYGYIELGGSTNTFKVNLFQENIFGSKANNQISRFFWGWTGRLVVDNNIFLRNGEYVKQSWDGVETSIIGVHGWGDTAYITNNTFIQNDAVAVGFTQVNKSAVVVNNLFYKNKADFSFEKYNSGNNQAFVYSNISNNILTKDLASNENISSYAYRSDSKDNIYNVEYGFKDTINYRLGNSSAAIAAGVNTISKSSGTVVIFKATSTDYYGTTRSTTKTDIGAEQTAQQFPAPGLKGEAANKSLTINWNKSNPNIAGYYIYRSDAPIPDNASTPYTTINRGDSLSLTESNLVNQGKYYYRIQAYDNASNRSGLSNEVLLRPNTVPTKLENITVAAGPRKATIEWKKKADVYTYSIFRGPTEDSMVLIAGPIDSSYYVDADVTVNKKYFYGVKVTDSLNVKSPISNVISVVPNNLIYVDTTSKVIQNGSKSYPFTTLTEANAFSNAGDTIIIGKGTVTMTETIRYSKNITFASAWILSGDAADIEATKITSNTDIGSLFQRTDLWPRPVANFIGLTFYKNASQIFNIDYANVKNCVFDGNGQENNRSRYFIGFSGYSTITNSTFSGNYGYIQLNERENVFRQNKFINNYHGSTNQATPLIGGWVGKLTIENNYFIKNGTYYVQPWDDLRTDVIRLEGWTDTTIIANNTFIGNDAVAIQFMPNNKNAIVVNNLFYNNRADFSFYKFQSGNNSVFSYSNISNNLINQSLDKYANINSYAYKANSFNNVLNGNVVFADTVTYKLGSTSTAIASGAKLFKTSGIDIYLANGKDYFGASIDDKVDIGAHQTSYAFPAPSLNEVEGGNTKVKVSWLKSSKVIKGYKLYRSTTSISDNATLTEYATVDKPDSLFINDNAVSNGTKYYYRVKAYDSSATPKYSGFSNELNVIPNIPPAKVSSFAGEGGPRVNLLTWTKSNLSSRFTLYRGIKSDSLVVVARGIDTSFYVDKNLEKNKDYYYAIKVTDAGGAASELSDVLKLTTNNILFVDTTLNNLSLGTAKKPFNTIQDAINAASDEDTILVKPGAYSPFRIANKAVFVKSSDGPSKTFISSTSQADYYLIRVDGNDNDSRPYKSIQVEGFTLNGMKNWRSGDWAAVISVVNNTSPVFKNNIIRDAENFQTLSIHQSAPTFINNLFYNNKGNFLNVGWLDSTAAQYKMPRFINCTFTKTQNWGNNGTYEKALIPFVNCIFWSNDPSSQISANYYSIRNSIVEYQNFAKKNGNLRIDPLFVSEETGDYRLSNSSPALGKGVSSITVAGQTLISPENDLVKNARPGPDLTKPDLGAYENPFSFPAPSITRLQKSGDKVTINFKYDKTLEVSKLILYRDSSAAKLDTLSIALKDINADSIRVVDTLSTSSIVNYGIRAVVNDVKSGISNILSTIDTTYVPDVLFESDTASVKFKAAGNTLSFVNLNGSDYKYPSVLLFDNTWKSANASNRSPNDSVYLLRTSKSDKANQSVKLTFNKRIQTSLGQAGDMMQVLGPINLNFDDEFDFASIIQKPGFRSSAGNLIFDGNAFALNPDSLTLKFNQSGGSVDTAVTPTFSFSDKYFDYNNWSRNQANIKDALDMIDGNFDGTQEHIISISQLKWVPKFNSPNGNCYQCINNGIRIVKFIDINKDGLKDIVGVTGDNWQVGYPNTQGVSVHVFVSNKILGQYEMYRTGLFIDWGSSMFVNDYNNDGRADILCRSINQQNYSIYELGSNYSFKESNKVLAISSDDNKITSDDVNNDGYQDVVTVTTNGLINIYLNDQKNGFKVKRYNIPFDYSNNNIWSINQVKLIDMNGDGFKDLVWMEQIYNGSAYGEQVVKTVIQTPGELVVPNSVSAANAKVEAVNDGYNVKIKWSGFTDNSGNRLTYNFKVDTTATYINNILNTSFNYKKSAPQIPIVLDQVFSSAYSDSIVFRDPNISSKYPYVIAVQGVAQGGAGSDFKQITFKPKDPLSKQTSTLPGLTNARFAWGDYNNDGQLDLAVIGLGDENTGQVLKIYKNDKGNLVDLELKNRQLKEGDVKWVDIDKDGWLDLIATGQSGSVPYTVLFKNNEGIFEVSYPTNIPALKNSTIAMGDHDNNGTVDMVISGKDAVGEPHTYMLNNDGRGNFKIVNDFNTKYVVPDLYSSDMRFIDYDLDGDLDLIFTGIDRNGNPQGGIRLNSLLDDQSLRNNQFYFNYGLNLKNARFDLGDVDSDGDLDIIVMGTYIENTLEKPITKLIKNTSADSKLQGNYNNQNIYNNYQEVVIDSLNNGDVKFADVNNDGLLDISISGLDNKKNPTTRIYINQGGFGNYSMLKTLDLPQFRSTAISWGDYNNDGNMDMVITGAKAIGTETVIYVNDQGSNKNVAPKIPTGLTISDLGQGKVKLKWDAPKDDHTPSKSLSYLIKIGTKPGSGDLSTVQVDSAGRLQSPTIPVVGTNEYYLELLPGKYYWSVMAIDGNFKNSKFSTEQAFILKYPWKYINQGGIVDRRITPIDNSQFAWADFDNDGFSDFIYLGNSGVWGQSPAGIYRNSISTFVKVENTSNGTSGLNGIDNIKNINIQCKDINNDGYVDIFVAGEYNDNRPVFKAFINKKGFNFQEVTSLFSIQDYLRGPALDFADLDNNGTPDMIYSGTDSRGVGQVLFFTTKLDSVAQTGTPTPGSQYGFTISTYETNIKKILNDEEAQNINLAFTDFNRDKRVDMVMLYDNYSGQRKIEVYNGSLDIFGKCEFIKNTDVLLPKLKNSTLDVVDFNKDGYPDIAMTGYGSTTGQVFKIFQNIYDLEIKKYTFTDIQSELYPIQDGKTTWGDFNMDGYPDVIFSGSRTGVGYVTKMATSLQDSQGYVNYTELPSFPFGEYLQLTPTMGDVVGDGQLGLVLVGTEKYNNSVSSSFKILQNVRGLSSRIQGQNGIVQGAAVIPFTPNATSSNVSADQLSLNSGKIKSVPKIELESKAFPGAIPTLTQELAQQKDNQTFVENKPPSSPDTLKATILSRVGDKNLVKLSWSSAKDDLTPIDGLTYAVRIGRKPGKSDVIDAESNKDGDRKTPTDGNTENNKQWDIQLPSGTYYWSVQAVDASFAGSAFSQESTIIIQNDQIVSGSAPSDILLNSSTSDTVYLSQSQLYSAIKYKISAYSIDSVNAKKYFFSLYDDDDFSNPNIFAIDPALNNLYFKSAYTKDSTYKIRMRVTDIRGLAYDKYFNFIVVAAPTNLLLDGASTSFVNYTTAKDVDKLNVQLTGIDDKVSSDKLTYTLVDGTGANNNSLFGIKNGNILYNKVALKLADTLRVRVSVFNGYASYEKAIKIYAGCDFTSTKFTDAKSGSYKICEGDVVNLTLAKTGVTVNLFKDDALLSTTSNTNKVSITAPGKYYAIYSTDATSVCGNKTDSVFVEYSVPVTSISYTGDLTICSNTERVLNATAATGYTYQWLKNDQVITGSTGSSYSAKEAGKYKVKVTNSQNCSATSGEVVLSVIQAADVTLSQKTDTTICEGTTIQIRVPDGQNSYQWFKNGIPDQGNSNSYTFSGNGTISVRATSANGCIANSATRSITTTSNPVSPVLTQTATALCQGQSVVIMGQVIGGVSYQWLKDGAKINGATEVNYSATSTGNYQLQLTNSFGCIAKSANATITSKPLPAAPSITRDVSDLVSSSADGNQWYNSLGEAIPGATSQKFRPASNGYFTVKTTINGCTSLSSANYYYASTAVLNLGNGQFIKLFPNPVINGMKVEYNLQGMYEMSIQLFDMNGKLVLERKTVRTGNIINLTNLSKGTYMMKVMKKDGKVLYTGKIAKQ
ncbi:MAG: hypothetical protein RL634_681, partial [Bacteroidota bacterium]